MRAVTVWVLWWRYSDGSGAGVYRVYLTEVRARQDFDLIGETDSAREWLLDPVELFV